MTDKRYFFISLSLLSLFSSCSTSLQPASPSLDQTQVAALPGPICLTSLQSTSPSSGQIQVASPPPVPTHFFLSVDKSTLVIEQGSFAAVDVAAVDADSNLVLREVSGGGRPSGMSISPKLPLTLYGGEGSFNVNVDSTVAPGKYSFSVRATLPGKTTPVTNAVKIEVEVLKKKYDWVRQFGTTVPDETRSVTTDPCGNVYVAGRTVGVLPGQTSSGFWDAFVIKYDSKGNQLWTQQFGTSSYDYAQSIAVDSSGNVYVAGKTGGALPGQTNSGNEDAFVRKYDTNGKEIWTKQFGPSGDDTASSVAVDASGNVYVAGNIRLGIADQDVFIKKYDFNGNELWAKQFGTTKWDYASSVAVDASGNVYVAGLTWGALPGQVNLGEDDAFVRKYDPNGNALWTQQFGTTTTDEANSVATDPSGNIYVTGNTYGTFPGQTSLGYRDAFVRKYDPNGNALWTQQFGTTTTDEASSVAVDASRNVYVAGWTWGTLPGQTHLGENDAFVRKYDSLGNELWTRQFGSNEEDMADSVATDASGNVYVAGNTGGTLPGQVNLGSWDAFLYKFAP